MSALGRVACCAVNPDVTTRPMLESDRDLLATLFESRRSTRHCWCMAFCSTRRQFSTGWFGGGNARRFAELAADSASPMGILAFRVGEVVGWCACGPRSRYAVAGNPRTELVRDRERAERGTVWFVPCFIVKAEYRGQGLTHALARAAVDLAREEGAVAIEGWPISDAVGPSGDAFVGRQQVFDDLGFKRVARPDTDRVIMRLELASGPGIESADQLSR